MSVTDAMRDRRCHALVPCAGSGSRAGGEVAKQYMPVAGKAVVAHTLNALGQIPRLASTRVVLAPNDAAFEQHVALPPGGRISAVRCGGATRAQSVGHGLDALLENGAREHDWVLVHDAARCLIRPEWVDRLIDACFDDPVGGLLAIPVADTLKAERDGRAAATLERRGTWQAQTPQMFPIGRLRAALQQAGPDVTDEAGAMELCGHRPLLVPGALENFKLTHPADFALAERLLSSRAGR